MMWDILWAMSGQRETLYRLCQVDVGHSDVMLVESAKGFRAVGPDRRHLHIHC